jgi:hypothetical protein
LIDVGCCLVEAASCLWDKRSVTELEADEVGASLKWATAKVERTSQRGNGDRAQGRERQAERGDFNEPAPF